MPDTDQHYEDTDQLPQGGYLPDAHSDPGDPAYHEVPHDQPHDEGGQAEEFQSVPKVSPGQFVRYTLGEGPSAGQERIAQVILPPTNVERDASLLDLYVFERPEDRPHESPAQVLQFEPAVPYNREGGPGTWREMEV